MWESNKNFIVTKFNDGVELLNINEQYLQKLAIDW